jgi:hypothetical protein
VILRRWRGIALEQLYRDDRQFAGHRHNPSRIESTTMKHIKNQRALRKITLNRETVRELSHQSLAAVPGGHGDEGTTFCSNLPCGGGPLTK